MALILLGFGCLLIWSICVWMDLICKIAKWTSKGIYHTVVEIYTYFFITKPLQKSGALERREMEKRLIKAEEKEKEQSYKLTQHNRIVQAGLIKLNEFRIKYPYAEEYLFQNFIAKFASFSVKEIQEQEQIIKKSHIANELKYATTVQEEYKYTLADINGLTPLEEKREDPMIMRIYKVRNDYILHIVDVDKNIHTLLQSKDYLAISKMMVVITERMREVRSKKRDIQAINLNVLFENVVEATQSFRRNKMDFLD